MSKDASDEFGQAVEVTSSAGRGHIQVQYIREIKNQADDTPHKAVYYKGTEFDLARRNAPYKELFANNGMALIPVVSREDEKPVTGSLNARFTRVVNVMAKDVPVLSHDASDKKYIPVSKDGSVMRLKEVEALIEQSRAPKADTCEAPL